jgi:hypothetical protein
VAARNGSLASARPIAMKSALVPSTHAASPGRTPSAANERRAASAVNARITSEARATGRRAPHSFTPHSAKPAAVSQ